MSVSCLAGSAHSGNVSCFSNIDLCQLSNAKCSHVGFMNFHRRLLSSIRCFELPFRDFPHENFHWSVTLNSLRSYRVLWFFFIPHIPVIWVFRTPHLYATSPRLSQNHAFVFVHFCCAPGGRSRLSSMLLVLQTGYCNRNRVEERRYFILKQQRTEHGWMVYCFNFGLDSSVSFILLLEINNIWTAVDWTRDGVLYPNSKEQNIAGDRGFFLIRTHTWQPSSKYLGTAARQTHAT